MATAKKTAAKTPAAKTPAKKPAAKTAAPAKAPTAAKAAPAVKPPAAKPAKVNGEGRTSYAGKTIVPKVELAASGLREGTNRYNMLKFVLKHTETDKVIGKDVGDGVLITGANLAGMVERGHIALK